jgi:AcrR family transcriptional regulator
MRLRDEAKKDALFNATIQVVNEEGFASASVNKIAKRACISPGTLYIYFNNKEDLLVSTFLTLKTKLSEEILRDFGSDNTLKENVRSIWFRLFQFVSTNLAEYQYIDQFSNSPFIQLVDIALLDQPFVNFHQALQRGMDEGIIKDIPMPVLRSFILAPAVFLARSRLGASTQKTTQNIEIGFELAWSAITS